MKAVFWCGAVSIVAFLLLVGGSDSGGSERHTGGTFVVMVDVLDDSVLFDYWPDVTRWERCVVMPIDKFLDAGWRQYAVSVVEEHERKPE